MKIRSYYEMLKFKTFEERFEYLKLGGEVGKATFGFERYLNQILYNSKEWRSTRRGVIIRDNGCDLGIYGREIEKDIIIHHMNPITVEQIEDRDPVIFDPDFLICVTKKTHNAIHYGNRNNLQLDPIERKIGDTKLW